MNYLGTPDDQRMFQSFGEDFGEIFIGEETSGGRVTDLEPIRFRMNIARNGWAVGARSPETPSGC